MIHINKLTVKNYRPYYKIHTFDFGEEEGLSIVIGDNGIGKTSLIRAIKFVLYGDFDSEGAFKIKNELNIIAWEEQDYELFVGLEFTYNSDRYSLKRLKRSKKNIHGEPKADADFESATTLAKNDIVLAEEEANAVLKNIIPKKISEFILFEGETISKYKDLLDNKKNYEIYESIKKILGITILENSKYDLEKFFDHLNDIKGRMIKEKNRNKKWLIELDDLREKKINYEKMRDDAKEKYEKTTKEISDITSYLKTNQRMKELIERKDRLNTELLDINSKILDLRNKIKNILKNYKSLIYDSVVEEIQVVPEDIVEIKKKCENNSLYKKDIEELRSIITEEFCKYCGHEINNVEELKKRIEKIESKLLLVTEDELYKLSIYDEKIFTLKTMISTQEKFNFKQIIKDIETELNTYFVRKENISSLIRDLNIEIKEYGDSHTIDQKIKEHAIAVKNQEVYYEIIEDCDKQIKRIRADIDSILRRNPSDIDLSGIDKRINTTTDLIQIFDIAIDNYSIKMREKVQKDASIMFSKVSDNREYSRLEFDEFYGLKLLDREGREVPNISSGYMTLITISLIYGLHKNSTLTGTIILDAPFSVLTNTHRDNIIKTFQELSPQVLLLVYKDQIDISNIRKIMGKKLIKEYEIYQDKTRENYSYKTSVKGINNG